MGGFDSSVFDLPKKILNTNVTDNIGNVMKTVSDLSSVTLDKASSSFNSLSTDSLALVDADSKNASDIITGFIDRQAGLLSNVLTKLKDSSTDITSIIGSIDLKDGLKQTSEQMLSRVTGAIGLPISSLSGFKGTLQDELLKNVNAMTGGYMSEVVTLDGGSIKLNGRWRENAADGVLSFLNRVSDSSEMFGQILDNQAANAFLNTVMKQTIRLGLYDGIPTLLDKYVRKSDGYDAVSGYSSIAANYGDVDMMKTILDTVGSDRVLAQTPNSVELILKNYSIPRTATSSDYPELTSSLTSTLSSIDPNWWRTDFNGLPATNYSVFTNISPDAANLLKKDTRFMDAIAIGNNYRTDVQIQTAKKMYPNMVVIQ